MEQQSVVIIQPETILSDVESSIACSSLVSRNHNQQPRRLRIEKLRKKRSQLIATKNRSITIRNNCISTTTTTTSQLQHIATDGHEREYLTDTEITNKAIDPKKELNSDTTEHRNKKMSEIDCGCGQNLTNVLPPEEYELLLTEETNNEPMTSDTTPNKTQVENNKKSNDSTLHTDECEIEENRNSSKKLGNPKKSKVDRPVTMEASPTSSDSEHMDEVASSWCETESVAAPPVKDVFVSMSEWMKENFQSKSVLTTSSLDNMMASCPSCYCSCCHYAYNEEQPENNPHRCSNKTDVTTASMKTCSTSKTSSTSAATVSSKRCAAAPKVLHEPLIHRTPGINHSQRDHRTNRIVPDRSLTDDLDDELEEDGEGRNPKPDPDITSELSSAHPDYDSDDDVIVSGILPKGVPYQISRILIEGWLFKKGTGKDWLHSRSWKVRYGKLCMAYIYSDEYRNGSLEVPLLCIYWYETSRTPTTVIVLDSTVVLSSNKPSKGKVDKKANSTPDKGEKATTVSNTSISTTKRRSTTTDMNDDGSSSTLKSCLVPNKNPLDEKYLFEIRHATLKQNSTLPVTRIFATATTHARNEWVYRISDALLSYNKDKASRVRSYPRRFIFSTVLTGCNDTLEKSDKQLSVIDPVRVITSRPRGVNPRKIPHALPTAISPARRPPTSPVRSRSPSPPPSSARPAFHRITITSTPATEQAPTTPTTTRPLPFFCDYEVWPRSGLSY